MAAEICFVVARPARLRSFQHQEGTSARRRAQNSAVARCVSEWAKENGAPCRTRTCDLLVRSQNQPPVPPLADGCQGPPECHSGPVESAHNAEPPAAAVCGDVPVVVVAKGQEKGNV